MRWPTGRATCRCRRRLAALGVKGLWFDTDMFGTVLAPSGGGAAAALPQGAQGIGNSAPRGNVILDPQDIAQDFYNFPLSGALWDPSSGRAVSTGTIGLLEPGDRQRARAGYAGGRIPGAAGCLSPRPSASARPAR